MLFGCNLGLIIRDTCRKRKQRSQY
uniref:Uncharacterized protein n=1 Tax=Anguilla anguilla TaxID=7936 RepID=A0A0E9TFW2_ANGAN